MATTKDRALSRQLNALFNLGAIRELTDGQLLARFGRGDGEAAELAFAALVERHGAMVLRVCQVQLADSHDIQDAFQATFLVLVEKARGLWVRDSLGPWLHQVALRTASCARSSAIRRRRLERRAAEDTAHRGPHEDDASHELARALHEEIERLPERYRVPIVLCDLEGRTCEEAARVMGRPVGTIKCWRARGRERLRHRLIRAGLAPSVAAGAAMFPNAARAAIPKPAAEQAVRAAVGILSGRMIAGVVPASVSMLVKGVIQAMALRKLRSMTAVICTLSFLAGGFVAVTRVAAEDPKRTASDSPAAVGPHRDLGLRPPPTIPDPTTPAREKELAGVIDLTRPPNILVPQAPDRESWALSLREAIKIGLANSRAIRFIRSGGLDHADVGRDFVPAADIVAFLKTDAIVIAPRSADVDAQRFRAEIMAEVRSIEQQYWTLAAAHVQLWAADRAVSLAEEVLNRERAELKAGGGTAADVAEAGQRLEQFNLDLVVRTSDVITTERQLRNLLGLPPADNRRIVPATPATEVRHEPDWDKALATMLENQPDIQLARAAVREAERLATSTELNRAADALRPNGPGEGKRSPTTAAVAGHPSPLVERQNEFLQQVVHQTTHSLARFFLEIDANYKEFRTATRMRASAAQRLDSLRADYEAGRIPIDRFFDAVSQYATSVATEAQYRATYNITLAALEEAKGTLLEHDRIIVTAAATGTEPPIVRRDGGVKPAAHQPTAATRPPAAASSDGLPAAGTPPKKPDDKDPDADGKTYSFQLTVGAGPRPFEVRGSFTVAPARDSGPAAAEPR